MEIYGRDRCQHLTVRSIQNFSLTHQFIPIQQKYIFANSCEYSVRIFGLRG
jgi:hypothetical protein